MSAYCLQFAPRNPTKLCGRTATRMVGVALGRNGTMKEQRDALMFGYVPLCPHHVESLPATVTLVTIEPNG
jgi:hypothetical protein